MNYRDYNLIYYWKNQGSPFLGPETGDSFQEHNKKLLILKTPKGNLGQNQETQGNPPWITYLITGLDGMAPRPRGTADPGSRPPTESLRIKGRE